MALSLHRFWVAQRFTAAIQAIKLDGFSRYMEPAQGPTTNLPVICVTIACDSAYGIVLPAEPYSQ
jgi:hypothetical protein